MFDTALMTLVRTTLLAGLPTEWGCEVVQSFNPTTVGVPSGPVVYTQIILPARRVGWLGRRDRPMGDAPMRHEEVQWYETSIQVSAMAPAKPLETEVPTAMDICIRASSILQGDRGLSVLAAHRVRPLRITDVRITYPLNDRDQYEAYPSFDVVLSHVQTIAGETEPVSEITGRARSVP